MTPVTQRVGRAGVLRVVVIGAGPEVIPHIEPELGSLQYQVAFVGRARPAYAALRYLRPNVVVLCFAPEDDEACRLLTLLQFDPVLCRVPILVCMGEDSCTILGSRWSPSDERLRARNAGAR